MYIITIRFGTPPTASIAAASPNSQSSDWCDLRSHRLAFESPESVEGTHVIKIHQLILLFNMPLQSFSQNLIQMFFLK